MKPDKGLGQGVEQRLGCALSIIAVLGVLALVVDMTRHILGSAGQDPELNMRQLSAAMQIYTFDSDGRFPPAPWMDAVTPFTSGPKLFQRIPQGYGVAMNSATVGALANSFPATTPLIFDSTLNQWNAVSSTSTLPHPGRYQQDGETFGNFVATVDGSVTFQPSAK